MEHRYRIVFALWFFQVANYFDRTVISFAAPAMMKSLHLTPAMFGVVLSAFGVGYALAQIPGGILSDRLGAKAILVIAPLLWALFTGVTGLVLGLGTLVAVRVCLGLSEGISNGPSVKVQGDLFSSRERSMAGSLWSTSFAIAPALAGPAVAFLIVSLSWRWVFVVLVVPALLAAALNAILIPAYRLTPAVAASRSHASLTDFIRLPSFWLVTATWFFFYMALFGFLGWLPSYLNLQRHVDLKTSGLLGAIPFAFGALGLVILGWLGSTRLYRLRPQLLCVTYAVAAAALYLAYAATTLNASVVGLSVAAFFIFGSMGTFGAIVLEIAPPLSRGAYWGTVSTVGTIGGIIAPSAIGYLVSATGTFAGGFTLMAGSLALASLCVMATMPFLPRLRPQGLVEGAVA